MGCLFPKRRFVLESRAILNLSILSFLFADDTPRMWRVIVHFFVQRDYSVRMGIRKGSRVSWFTRGRVPLKQSEMVGILGLQRVHQNLKLW